jgi:hypothetical protein
MNIRDGFIATVGNTPLIKLRKASEITGCTILGKAEFLNPGGSVKDRAALAIIQDAEAKGLLKPGGVIVEGTAGNTGIGLALVGNARGYRTVIVIPETQSQEKKDVLRLIGAELREVPAAPYKNPNNYVHVSERLAKELATREPNGVLWANQWDNLDDRTGDLAADRRQGGRLHLRRRYRRHPLGRRHLPEGAQPEDPHRPGRSRGRRTLQLLQAWRVEGRRQLDHRRHRPGPHHEECRRHARRCALPDPR